MNSFEQLVILYNQFFNLAAEIKTMIENEEYNEAMSKLQYKNTLIDKLAKIKKNAELNEEQKEQLKTIEEKFKEIELSNIKMLEGLRSEISTELNKVKGDLKIASAYSSKTSKNAGSILDLSE